jgi:hypothetical protein
MERERERGVSQRVGETDRERIERDNTCKSHRVGEKEARKKCNERVREREPYLLHSTPYTTSHTCTRKQHTHTHTHTHTHIPVHLYTCTHNN